MQRKYAAIAQKIQRIFLAITKNTTKNRLSATENAPSLFYTPCGYSVCFNFPSSICTNQALAFQLTCLYLRRNSARVSMLSVTGQNYGYIWLNCKIVEDSNVYCKTIRFLSSRNKYKFLLCAMLIYLIT